MCVTGHTNHTGFVRFEPFIGSNMTQQTEIDLKCQYFIYMYYIYQNHSYKFFKKKPNSTIILVHGHDENLHVLNPKMYSNSHITHVNLLLPEGVSHQS